MNNFYNHRHVAKWAQNDSLTQLGDALCNALKVPNSNVILIGTGFFDEQYYDWPEILEDVWGANVSYVEICDEYINKWKDKKYPVIKGDVTQLQNADIRCPDCIFWFQGPEHIHQNQMLPTFNLMFNIARRAIICTCPWGAYYDRQETLNNNVWEAHKQKSMTASNFGPEFKDYTISYGGGINTASGQILIQRMHE